MQDLYRIKPMSMLGWWIACSIFVFPLATVAIIIIGVPSLYTLDIVLFPHPSDYPADNAFIMILAIPAIGAIIGASMAFLQRWILRTKLYWTADHWLHWTILGGAVGAIFVVLISAFAETIVDSGNNFLFLMPVFLGVVSTFQVIALRHAVKQSWLWIIGNIVGGIVFAGIAINNEPPSYSPISAWISLFITIMTVGSLGLITGFVLLFLFEKKLLPMTPETKDSLEKEDNDTPKSIWDRAI